MAGKTLAHRRVPGYYAAVDFQNRKGALLPALLILATFTAASGDPLVDMDDLSTLARRRVRCEEPDKELERLRSALKTDPRNDSNWARAGWTYLADRDPSNAERCARTALRIRPYNSRYLLLLAYSRLALGRIDGTGTILARARQSNAIPFNHVRPKDIPGLLKRIESEDARRSVNNEMQASLKTNTFRLSRGRSKILGEASLKGRVLTTWREPENKYRLWIALEKRFLLVFDEERDAFENHASPVEPLGLHRSTVKGLAFTSDGIVALTDGRLVSLDKRSGQWRAVEVCPAMRKTEITSLDSGDSRSVRVTFSAGGDQAPLKKYTYAPAGEQWIPGADVNAASSASQLKELETYLKTNAPAREIKQSTTPNGRLSLEALRSVAAAAGAPGAPPRRYLKGVTLPAWNRDALTTPEAVEALRRIRELGAEWVSLTPTGYQNDPLSTDVARDIEKTPSLESIENTIERAHKLGLKVLLKPHINMLVEMRDNHMWRGMIRLRDPEDVEAWFKSYETFLMRYVDLAARQGIEMMTVGVELRGMIDHDTHWRRLIARIRQSGYKGKLTYAALHETYEKVKFWDALDCVGIDAYFTATRTNSANLRQIMAGYGKLARRLASFSAEVGKPIVLTEIGFNNLDGCNVKPWYWSGNPAAVDNIEQASCYHAVLETFPRQDWFAGMFWWCWNSYGAPRPSEPSYSPQSKLAELILEAYY